MELVIDHSFDYITQETEFHYAKAQELWQQWKQYVISADDLELLQSLSYGEFKVSSDPLVSQTREFLFRFIAYADAHARDKIILNEYDDKRTVARSNIYQDDWVKQLLRYKSAPDNVSPGIRNLINYLEDPEVNWPIVSDEHKKWIYECFVGKPYNPALFNSGMEEHLGKFWTGVNPLNKTCYLTSLIYSMYQSWKRDKSKSKADKVEGLFVHESNDQWKEKLINEVSPGKKGCVWWHSKPKRYANEILGQLTEIVSSGETFDLYFLRDNRACYRAVISSFATSADFDVKKEEWKQYSPAWMVEDFSDFMDEKRQAEIVFLADRFERLVEPIPLACFRKYKNMNYNVRTGMAAFSSIMSKEELDNLSKVEKYKKILQVARNMILTGAPGTGKTYLAKQIAESMGAVKEMVQFHPSYDYTDFVEGLRPIMKTDDSNIGFELKRGIFKEFCAKAYRDFQEATEQGVEPTPYVFIIDEINRGDVAKIFGELFFAIDPNYRGEQNKIATQYQNLISQNDIFANGFFVPENVFIIGTMNDIDRSVETIDFAFRRRFVWPRVKASDTIGMLSVLGGLAAEATARMNNLNKAIEKVESLSEDYHIGGAYFLKVKQLADDEHPFDRLWEFCIEPLLVEYLRGTDYADDTLVSLKSAFDNASDNAK